MTVQEAVPADDSTREGLTRVLAVEGRNALARVELAASELARFDATPGAALRLSTIHQAVHQIDGLLAKIDLLANPRFVKRFPEVDVGEVWRRVRDRLRPTLLARGLLIDEDELPEEQVGIRHDGQADLAPAVRMPEPVLESILCGLLRLVLGGLTRDGRLRFEAEHVDDTVRIVLIGSDAAERSDPHAASEADPSTELDRERSVELEVQLAEWGGELELGSRAQSARVEVRLPAGPLDDR